MKDFFVVIEDAYDLESITLINNAAKNFNIPEDINSPAKDTKKTSFVKIIPYGCIEEEIKRFKNICLDVNKHMFGFDLFEFTEFNSCMHNTYNDDVQSEYDWHWDSIANESYDIKLTGILNISDSDYEGGEFFLFNGESIEIKEFAKPGSMIVFPSWVQHRVSPVTKGTRKSFTMFFTGPTFK